MHPLPVARRTLMSWVLLGATALLLAPLAGAQQPRGSEPSACYGFAFGPWNPPLDWVAAGHRTSITAQSGPQAPGSRSWAMNDAGRDSVLMLLPAWWPAGVEVAFERPPRAPNDTVVGRALALVADGRLRSPTARVRAWVVPCASR